MRLSKEKVLVLAVALTTCVLIGACATNTGVVPIGLDTYMISRQSASTLASGSGLKAELYREAGAFCVEQGKVLMPVSTSAVDGMYGGNRANAELNFRCLAQDDPELARPTMKQTPDTLIEIKE